MVFIVHKNTGQFVFLSQKIEILKDLSSIIVFVWSQYDGGNIDKE